MRGPHRSDQSRDTRTRQFMVELMVTMTQTTKIFRLRAEGLAALSKPLVAELVSPLGEIIKLKMYQFRRLRRHRLHHRSPNRRLALPEDPAISGQWLDLQAKLSVTPESSERPELAHRVQRHEAKRDALAGDQVAGWQVVERRPKVTKRELCRDFARGVCARGAKCILRHSKEACRTLLAGGALVVHASSSTHLSLLHRGC
jgi:hypothetical protein